MLNDTTVHNCEARTRNTLFSRVKHSTTEPLRSCHEPTWKFTSIIIHSGWRLAWIFIMKESFKLEHAVDGAPSQIPRLLKKFNNIWPFDPTQGHQFDPRVNVLPALLTIHPLQFDMPHDHVWKNHIFDPPKHPLVPPLGHDPGDRMKTLFNMSHDHDHQHNAVFYLGLHCL